MSPHRTHGIAGAAGAVEVVPRTLPAAFDAALAIVLIGCAAVLLASRDLFKAIVLFIAFGLLMSVAWARLDAVDVALAEAAIGAGLTGALLLNARGELEARARRPGTASSGSPGPDDGLQEGRRPAFRLAAAAAVLPVGAGSAWAVLTAPRDLTGIRPWAAAQLGESGVENPVTAVLLNFRAWDTLLEIAVLVLAVVGAWSQRLPRVQLEIPPPGRILVGALRLLAPATVLIGGYLLWKGSHAPGGAFQAGAVLAGAGVLVLLAERPLPARWSHSPLRIGLGAGVLVFLGIGCGTLLLGERFLFYRGDLATTLILGIEVAATSSIALALAAVFVGRAPPPRRRESS